ncbi:type II toxin-antitoxin system ParD family antitoxin [Ottowia sp.]|uniref:type II toxin-antitoxin system ParD family antitoxin n=1 Tax=Ottowia sp. TaxID=1898956 RepID=UPI0039E3A84B
MSTMNISQPESLKAFVDSQVNAHGYAGDGDDSAGVAALDWLELSLSIKSASSARQTSAGSYQ